MTKTNPPVRLRSVKDLLAAVPVLCGFQPASSIVVIGVAAPDAKAVVALHYDLSGLPDAGLAASMAWNAASALAGNGIGSAYAVGYGPGTMVTPFADALREHLPQAGITVPEVLRVEGRRYWSYVCTDPSCCPAEGTPFDPDARMPGLEDQPVLASREELAASVTPVTGEEAASMARAARTAAERAFRLTSGGDSGQVRAEGLRAVGDAIARYRDGGSPLSHDEAAWLALSLVSLRVRDDAWSRMEPAYQEAHARLWTDLTRLAVPGTVAAPASLLAFTAWQSGNGALANVALDRAQADDPDYSMADLIRTAVTSGIPPTAAKLPMTPEEVAAAYAALGE